MKTLEEVEALKHNWANDPIWDIEDTEGFEDYYLELHDYRLQMIEEWKGKREYAKSPAGLIESAQYNLDRARDDRICQVSERHILLALAEATVAIAQLMQQQLEQINTVALDFQDATDLEQSVKIWGTGNVQQP